VSVCSCVCLFDPYLFLYLYSYPHFVSPPSSFLLSRIVRIRGIVMDSRGLPFGHPVAPNRIIANCLLAGTALHSHLRFFLFFSLLILISHSAPHTPFSPLTHSSHHSYTLLTTHTLFSPLTHSSHHFLGTSPVHRDSTVHDLRHYTHGIQGTARRRALTTNGIVTSNRESVNLSSSARSKYHITSH
jgi:hypothetical protein